MGIGTSNGKYYDDELHLESAPYLDTRDNNVIDPSKFQRDKAVGQDPRNIYDDQGNLVDYDFDPSLTIEQLPKPDKHSMAPATIQTVADDKPIGISPMTDTPEGTIAPGGGRDIVPSKTPPGYYDKVPQEMRLSRSSTEPSHPGFRWEVFDRQTGKVMRKDVMTSVGANRTVDSLDNKYGGYRYSKRMIKTDEHTEKEAQFLIDNHIKFEYSCHHRQTTRKNPRVPKDPGVFF